MNQERRVELINRLRKRIAGLDLLRAHDRFDQWGDEADAGTMRAGDLRAIEVAVEMLDILTRQV